VLGDGPIIGKTDVESEKVVRSCHSTQAHPETIEEVWRILSEHIEAMNFRNFVPFISVTSQMNYVTAAAAHPLLTARRLFNSL
jgi:hypothetical protein